MRDLIRLHMWPKETYLGRMLTFSRTCIAALLMIVEDEYDDILGGILNANNSDLTEFQNAGSKLIMFSGTADPLVPFPDAINNYERVISMRQMAFTFT